MGVEIHCPASGLNGLQWHADSTGVPRVNLHGWLDNAASFRVLVPKLSPRPTLALDLPGHGHSPWKGEGADYAIWNYTAELSACLATYSEPVDLIAHSMGASAALCLAAAFPELVRSLVLLDSPGPIVTPENAIARQLREGVDAQNKDKSPRVIATEDDALAIRQKATPFIPEDALRAMVQRNLVATSGGFLWRTDPRLKLASKLRLTEGQVNGLMQAVSCPVLAIRAGSGMIPPQMFEQRMAYLPNVRKETVAGHHHFHMEDEAATEIARLVEEFQESL